METLTIITDSEAGYWKLGTGKKHAAVGVS